MATTTRTQDLLSSEFLIQLERLALVSRKAFRGRTRGERKSPHKGMSVEFADYRPYGAGDDLRYVDWNIYGRLDRLYLKLFVDEEDLYLHLLLDGSASMSFGEPSKLRYAARLAAALGFVGLANLERVGVAVVRDRMAEGWSPARGRGHFLSLLEFASRLRPAGLTGLSEGLATYALRSREAGVAVLEHRFDLHVIHVLAPEEMNPVIAGDLRLTDVETGEVRDLTMDAEALRGYRQRLADFLGRAESFCRANEIVYHRVVTDAPVEEMVLRQLKGLLLA